MIRKESSEQTDILFHTWKYSEETQSVCRIMKNIPGKLNP